MASQVSSQRVNNSMRRRSMPFVARRRPSAGGLYLSTQMAASQARRLRMASQVSSQRVNNSMRRRSMPFVARRRPSAGGLYLSIQMATSYSRPHPFPHANDVGPREARPPCSASAGCGWSFRKPRMRLAAQHPDLVAFLFRLFLPAANCRIESKRMNK
jgi:hypothetical protein